MIEIPIWAAAVWVVAGLGCLAFGAYSERKRRETVYQAGLAVAFALVLVAASDRVDKRLGRKVERS